jgi:hydrogenase small subunit
MPSILWIETGSCSGETLSLLGAEGPGSPAPNFIEFLEETRLRLLWHPSFSLESPETILRRMDAILADEEELTLLCVEGSILNGPNGTGMFDTFCGRPKRDLIAGLSAKADVVIAMGTCAAFGGIPAAPPNPTEATGVQFTLQTPGGLLASGWRAKSGLPVVNLAGCPVSSQTMFATLRWILSGMPLEMDNLNRPFTVGPCNSDIFNKVCGKPRVGFSCYGCIGASFPKGDELFRPVDVSRIEAPLVSNGRNRLVYDDYRLPAEPSAALRVLPA